MNLVRFIQSANDALRTIGKALLGLDRPQLYRPEAHYMRGPGPKWHARHGEPQRAVAHVRRSAKAR